ncbi:hypothetical protein D3C76_1767020 [compost metagenome]
MESKHGILGADALGMSIQLYESSVCYPILAVAIATMVHYYRISTYSYTYAVESPHSLHYFPDNRAGLALP